MYGNWKMRSSALGPEHLVIGRLQGHQEGPVRIKRIQDAERGLIEEALSYYEGHQERAAASLGITSRTLRNKIRKYGLRK